MSPNRILILPVGKKTIEIIALVAQVWVNKFEHVEQGLIMNSVSVALQDEMCNHIGIKWTSFIVYLFSIMSTFTTLSSFHLKTSNKRELIIL